MWIDMVAGKEIILIHHVYILLHHPAPAPQYHFVENGANNSKKLKTVRSLILQNSHHPISNGPRFQHDYLITATNDSKNPNAQANHPTPYSVDPDTKENGWKSEMLKRFPQVDVL